MSWLRYLDTSLPLFTVLQWSGPGHTCPVCHRVKVHADFCTLQRAMALGTGLFDRNTKPPVGPVKPGMLQTDPRGSVSKKVKPKVPEVPQVFEVGAIVRWPGSALLWRIVDIRPSPDKIMVVIVATDGRRTTVNVDILTVVKKA